jgi:hypothetical protein
MSDFLFHNTSNSNNASLKDFKRFLSLKVTKGPTIKGENAETFQEIILDDKPEALDQHERKSAEYSY